MSRSTHVIDSISFCLQHTNLVDLYSVYCRNHRLVTQIVSALELDRDHNQWVSAYNAKVDALERGEELVVDQQSTSSNVSNGLVPNFIIGDQSDANSEVNAGSSADTDLIDPKTGCSVFSSKCNSLTRPLLLFSRRLLSPAQRFQRYHLLVQRLICYTATDTDRNDLNCAHNEMRDMCVTVNILMCIQGLSGRPSRLGRWLQEDKFSVWLKDVGWTSHQRHVFLFENAILLTKVRQPASILSSVLSHLASSTYSASSGLGVGVATSGSAGTVLATNQSIGSSLSGMGFDIQMFISPSATSSLGPLGALRGPIDPVASVYEIKMELSLLQIGLTPSIRQDKRRFAVWTANRAQTYYFQSSNSMTRTKWVDAINDLLLRQLKRLREASKSKKDLISVPAKEQCSNSSPRPL